MMVAEAYNSPDTQEVDADTIKNLLEDFNEDDISDLYDVKAENLETQVCLILDKVKQIASSEEYGTSPQECVVVEAMLNALHIGSVPSRIAAVRDANASFFIDCLLEWQEFEFKASAGHEETAHGELVLTIIQLFATCDYLPAAMALAPALEIYISKPSHGIKEAVVCNLLRMAEKWPDELGEEIAEILAAGLNVELPDTPNVLLEVLPKVYDVLPRAIETNLSGLVAPYKLLGTPRHLDHTILNILVTVATNKACLVLPYIGVVLDSIVIAQKGPKNKDLIFALFRKILFDDPIFVMQSMPDLNILAGNDEKYLAAVQGLRNYLGLNDHDGSTTSLDEP